MESEPETGTIWSLVPTPLNRVLLVYGSLTTLLLDTNESNSHIHNLFLYDPFNVITASAHTSDNLPLPFIFPTEIVYAFPISNMRATCHAHIIPADLIALIVFRKG
jgi:hypothetical protein